MKTLIIPGFIILSLLYACADNNKQTLNPGESYSVTVDEKDSSFVINLPGAKDNFTSELRVSDPECTECKDCYIDSGKIIIPDILKRYVKWDKDLFLTGNNPYRVEKTA